MSATEPVGYILATARELFGRVAYSHKVHEKERVIWSDKTCLMNRVNIVLVSLTTGFAVLSAAIEGKLLLVLTALFAAFSTGFVLWQSNFDPISRENLHRTAAKELLWLREQLFLLIERCHIATETPEQLQRSLESLTREVTAVYKFAPDTSAKAYGLAQHSLKNGELTFSDEEIDAFLPAPFRKKLPG